MQLDFAQSKNLSQQTRSGSTSVFTLPQFSFLLALLHPFRHRFRAAGGAEILRAANSAEIVDVKQMEKIVPLITCGIALCQYVCGVDIFDLNLWIQLNNQSSATLSGYMSHYWKTAFDDHLDHCFVVFKNTQLRLTLRRVRVCDNAVYF